MKTLTVLKSHWSVIIQEDPLFKLVWCYWEEDHRGQVAFSPQLVKDTYYHPDLRMLIFGLDFWDSLGQFLHCKAFPSFRMEYLHKWFRTLHIFFSSAYFISLLNHFLYQCYTLGYNLILLYLFCYQNCSSFGHWDIFQVVSLFLWHISLMWIYLFLSSKKAYS